MKYKNGLLCIALLLVLAAGAAPLHADSLWHALTGAVTKVDSGAKTLAVKSADGSEHVFKYGEKTSVYDSRVATHEVRMGAVDSYFKGKEGTQVVVRYTEKGTDSTAASIRDFGKDGLKVTEGTVDSADKHARTVTVKTSDGARKTYDVSKDAMVETEHGAVDASKWTYKQGDKVRVHYVDAAGKGIVHFIHKF